MGRSSGLAVWCVRASSSSRAGALRVGQGELVGGSREGARQGTGDRFSREFVAQKVEKAGSPGRARTCAPSSPEGIAWALRRREAFKWTCNPYLRGDPSGIREANIQAVRRPRRSSPCLVFVDPRFQHPRLSDNAASKSLYT